MTDSEAIGVGCKAIFDQGRLVLDTAQEPPRMVATVNSGPDGKRDADAYNLLAAMDGK